MFKNLFCKKIPLYLVYRNENPASLVTVLADKNQIDEFIDRMIIVDNWGHFKMWCSLRELDYKSLESQYSYIDNYVAANPQEAESKYTFIVRKTLYTKEALASILRMFNGCVPIGCSYESPVETTYANLIYSKLAEDADEKEATKNEA